MTAGTARDAIVAALTSAGRHFPITALRSLSGGCIHDAMDVTLSNGDRVIAKVNDAATLAAFEEEATSLRALGATHTVLVPQALATIVHAGCAVLLMTRIDPPASVTLGDADVMWRNFGTDLAALHMADLTPELSRGYGFTIDNHIGSTPQPNRRRDDWVEFNAEQRLGHQVQLARSRDLLTANESSSIESVIARLDRFLPRTPRPALLHGDLWSGNALPTARGTSATCAVIDPASYIGDALADIAMMQLFGGFHPACFAAWSDRIGVNLASAESRARLAVYQLYHMLNHVNIFGRGYVGQAMSLARQLT